MKRYRVAQVGLGARGMVHLNGFLSLPQRFEVVGLCDIDQEKLKSRTAGLKVATFTEAEKMLQETRPDVFCFVTHPNVRLEMVKLAAKYQVKGLALEKPMAVSLVDARTMRDICVDNKIKAVVSHQQKYLTSLQKVKEIANAGELGEIIEVRGSCTGSLTDLGTHYMDYLLWANNNHPVKWVVGHAHGIRELGGIHPSPDFFMARMEFANGVRGLLEIGTLATRWMGKNAPVWLDNRLTIIGTQGYAWGDTDGRWGALTRSSGGEVLTGFGPGYDPAHLGAGWEKQQGEFLQTPYLRDLADWLDDNCKVHSCNMGQAYHGFEILSAASLSALNFTRGDLPVEDFAGAGDVIDRMRKQFKAVPPLAQ
jgi:predicted dehydrogenase